MSQDHKFFVSRQRYYYSGESVVEVVSGGRDYANADMLVPKYDGEGQEYTDPLEAVEKALEILAAWRLDRPEIEIGIAVGTSAGMGMELEPDTMEYARAWAEKWERRIDEEEENGEY